MSSDQLSFPIGCFYCKSNFQSQNCLLPFSITARTKENDSIFDRVLQITEMHSTYGYSILEHNAAMEKLNSSNKDENELKRLLNFNALVLQTRNLSMNRDPEISESLKRGYQTESTQTSEYTPGEKSNDITLQSKEIQITESTKPNDERKVNKCLNKSTSSGDNSISWSDIVSDELDTKSRQEKEISQPRIVKPIKLEIQPNLHTIIDENHLVEDLLMIIKTAFIIQSTPRSKIKFEKLCNSIAYEMNVISSKGKDYKPTTNSELNGEIALSKQISARHSIRELEMWELDIQNEKGNSCIMNCPQFSSKIALESDDTLETTCVKCFNALMLLTQIIPEQKRDIIDSIRFQLEREGYNDAYSWIHKKSKLEYHTKSTTIGKGKVKNMIAIDMKYSQLAKYPAADERLLEYINQNLDEIIRKIIGDSKVKFTTLGKSEEIIQYFQTLSSEFLKQNKGWINENSFTSSNHLTKVLKLLNTDVSQAEAFKIFKILKSIIDEFRSSFKAKYKLEVK